ncbi:MAG TPA: tetratricopeptide repeat protein, partial [Candidatus Obscuribacter sp.]|nr:tetratricopeptide repeat protein [Candidatus Obscuribacter sp.]
GSLLTQEGDYAGAEEQYLAALNHNFYLVSAHYNLANLYVKQDKLNQAIKELKTCLKMQPHNAWAHNNLGVIYQKRNYLEEAAEEFLRALNLEPANKTFEANLNMVRQQLKKKPTRA